MITGIHTLLYSSDPDATRSFFRDVLKLKSVDAGRGWLIFALPPAELGIHPVDESRAAELYLMCDDLEQTLADLAQHGVEVTQPVSDQRWGTVTQIRIPGGAELGLYQAKHPTALTIAAEEAAGYVARSS